MTGAGAPGVGCDGEAAIERPVGTPAPAPQYGSDVVAETLRSLALPYIALNPGASFRGLHDSLVNHLGNADPQLLLALHEEHAVAIAHGYAKVTGRPLAVAVHSNVGLFHATMAIFNAWCDRMPVLIIGATGPVDAAKRRPWIDWMYSNDPAALQTYADFVGIPVSTAKRTRDDFFPRSSVDPDRVVGLDTIVPDAVALKYTAAPLSKEQLAELIQIPPR